MYSLKGGGHRHLIEIDTRFHEIIYQAAQNPILQENSRKFCTAAAARLLGLLPQRRIPVPESFNS